MAGESQEYFGYQRRGPDAFVDWAAIGQGMSDTFTNEEDRREKEKARLDQVYRDSVKAARETPQGESISANEWTLDYAASAQEQLLMTNKLLKSGLMKPRDVTVVNQNLMDATKTIYDSMELYQTVASEKNQRNANNESQSLEIDFMAHLEGMMDFNSSKPIIDPRTGNVSLGKFDKDGKMIGGESSILGVKQLPGMLKTSYDKFDLQGTVAKGEGLIGEYERMTKAYGRIDKVTNKTLRDDFKDLENNIAETIMANPYNALSILTEDIDVAPDGQLYRNVFSKEEQKSPSDVFVRIDASGKLIPELTPEQKDAVKERIVQDLKGMVDDKTEVKDAYIPQPRAKTAAEINAGLGARSADMAIDRIVNIFSGNDTQKQQGAEGYARWYNENRRSQDPRAVGGRIDETGFYLVDEDGKEIPRSFRGPSGETMGITDFAMGFTGSDPLLQAALDKINASDYQFVPPTTPIEFSVITEEVQDFENKTMEIDGDEFLVSDLVKDANSSEKFSSAINDVFRDNPSVSVKDIDKPWFTADKIILNTPDGEIRIPYSSSATERVSSVRELYEKYTNPSRKTKESSDIISTPSYSEWKKSNNGTFADYTKAIK